LYFQTKDTFSYSDPLFSLSIRLNHYAIFYIGQMSQSLWVVGFTSQNRERQRPALVLITIHDYSLILESQLLSLLVLT